MSNLDEVIRYSELLSLYQGLLSDTQKEILEDYFLYNLSMSEIAENRIISRSAVEDAIKKGKKKLEKIENELGSLKVLYQIRKLINETTDENIKNELEDIERNLKHGI